MAKKPRMPRYALVCNVCGYVVADMNSDEDGEAVLRKVKTLDCPNCKVGRCHTTEIPDLALACDRCGYTLVEAGDEAGNATMAAKIDTRRCPHCKAGQCGARSQDEIQRILTAWSEGGRRAMAKIGIGTEKTK